MRFLKKFLAPVTLNKAKEAIRLASIKLIQALLVTFLVTFNSYANSQKLQANLPFYTESARKMLNQSKYSNDFFQLVNFYQPQINPLYCGIATSVILLNAFHGERSPSQKAAEIITPKKRTVEFRSYLQSTFLNKKTDKIKKRSVIEFKSKNKQGSYDPGLTLSELSNILRKAHNLNVKKIYARKNDEKSLDKFRQNLKKYLADDRHFMVVNFDGKALGTKTGGHISPLAVYHEPSDSVLVLDVALHKGSWYFAPVERLYNAMHTKDGKKYRGYLIISQKK